MTSIFTSRANIHLVIIAYQAGTFSIQRRLEKTNCLLAKDGVRQMLDWIMAPELHEGLRILQHLPHYTPRLPSNFLDFSGHARQYTGLLL